MTATTSWPTWNGVHPLDWYRLIHQAEMIREHYHLGLARVWGYIHQGDYTNARARLDVIIADIKRGYCQPRSVPRSQENRHPDALTHLATYEKDES